MPCHSPPIKLSVPAKFRRVRVYALEEYMAREAINKKGVENTLLLGYGGLSEKEMAEGIRHLREM